MWFKEAIQPPATQQVFIFIELVRSQLIPISVIYKKPSFLIVRAGLPQESDECIEEITLTMYKKHYSQ